MADRHDEKLAADGRGLGGGRRPLEPYPGHEQLCADAVEFILAQPDHPVVVLAGPTGSGRGRLAEAALGRLAAEGYKRIPALLRPVAESEQIRTVDDLLEQVARSLPSEKLVGFLEANWGWVGARRGALLLDLLKERVNPAEAAPQIDTLAQQMQSAEAVEPASDQRENQTKKLADALYPLLVDDPVALKIDLTYATSELQLLAHALARLAAPPLGLLLIVDSEAPAPWDSLPYGIYREVLSLQPADIAQLCRRQGVELDDPVVFAQLHQLSAGLPELAELIVGQVRRHARTPAELGQQLLARTTATLDTVLRGFLNEQEAPIRALYALDGLLEAGALSHLQDAGRAKLLARFAQERLGAREASSGDTMLMEAWLQYYSAQLRAVPELRRRAQQIAFQQVASSDPGALRSWSAWIAAYLEQQGVRDPLLIAYYWLEGDRLGTARERIEPLFSEPVMVYDSRCAAPRALLERMAAAAQSDERANYAILAGDHASAEGAVAEAKDWYYRALQELPRTDPRCLAVFGKLMRAYQLPETEAAYAAMGRECTNQLANPENPPLLTALIKGWRAAALAALAQMRGEQEWVREAAEQLRAALDELEQYGLSRDGAAVQASYWRERAYLVDELARRELDLDNPSGAMSLFQREHDALQQSEADELLLARFKNNLGYVLYYIQGSTDGMAEAYFEGALAIRHRYGDQVGEIRAVANLVGLLGEKAKLKDEWEEAEKLCKAFSARARLLREVAPAIRMQSNLCEIRIRRGAIDEARDLLQQSLSDDAAGDYAPLLRLKLAWCDLWQGRLEQCRAALAELAEVLDDTEALQEDWWEWAQCVCELALHGAIAGVADSAADLLPLTAEVTAGAGGYQGTQRATADGLYTYGLFHLAHDDPHAAIDYLKRCRQLWAPLSEDRPLDLAVGAKASAYQEAAPRPEQPRSYPSEASIPHPFRAASAGVWLVYAEQQIGQRTPGFIRVVQKELKPFGDTPTRRLLARITGM